MKNARWNLLAFTCNKGTQYCLVRGELRKTFSNGGRLCAHQARRKDQGKAKERKEETRKECGIQQNKQNKTKQNKTKQNKTKQNKTKQNKTKKHKPINARKFSKQTKQEA